jgi:hypothetical protein
MPDEDFTSIEAALQVVEKFASRLVTEQHDPVIGRAGDHPSNAPSRTLPD